MMMIGRARRAGAAGLVAVGAATVVLLTIAPTAHAQAPGVAAWWNAANLGDPVPAPPAPPDVKDGQLLVQGSNAVADSSPLGVAPASSQAVAGVAFELPAGAIVGNLTLKISGSPPPQVSVVACQATSTFTNEDNAEWSHVPSYDGKACVAGKLKDATVVFAGIAKLATIDALRVVLLPGSLDRVVFEKPGRDSLDVRSGTGLGPAAPPVGSGNSVGSNSGGGGGGTQPAAPVGGSDVVGPPATNLPGTQTTGGAADVPPVVAGTQTPAPATRSAAAVATDNGLTTNQRRWIALAVIALEVLGFMALTRSPGAAAAPLLAGASTAGGRLRPPDRAVGGVRGTREGGVSFGGVGRFRTERRGEAPRL
jgi:hypothetical protein